MKFLLLVLVLSGCAHVDPEAAARQRYQQTNEALGSWRGKDVNRAFEALGPPTSVFQMPNGRTIYTWDTAFRATTSAYHSRWSSTAVDTTRRCRVVFTATPGGIVDKVAAEGLCGADPREGQRL